MNESHCPMPEQVSSWIKQLGLEKHPEGGWFKEAYRSSEVIAEAGLPALVGCTVSPGFDFADFEMPGRGYLLAVFPQHRDTITQLTR